jgi:hypothetical protein
MDQVSLFVYLYFLQLHPSDNTLSQCIIHHRQDLEVQVQAEVEVAMLHPMEYALPSPFDNVQAPRTQRVSGALKEPQSSLLSPGEVLNSQHPC